MTFDYQKPVYRSVQIDEDHDHDGFDASLFQSMGAFDDFGAAQLPNDVYSPHLSLNPKAGSVRPSDWYNRGASQQVQQKQEFFSEHLVASVRDKGPPSAPGGYLEPNFHFLSTSSWGEVFSALQDLLEAHTELPVDFSVKPTKYKLKCVAYPAGAKMPFNIRIFCTDTPNELAVEFQRRSGCIMAFSSLYRKLHREMQKLGLCKSVSSSSSSFGLTATDKLPCLEVDISPDQARVTIGYLVEMASSECVDIQRQALQTISKLTECKATQIALIDPALNTLLDCVSSPVECVHRCAVTSLANLTELHEGACEQLVNNGGVPSLLSLATSRSSCPQVVRECARALANVAGHMKSEVLCDDFKDQLVRLRSNRDSRTQGYMQKMDSCMAH